MSRASVLGLGFWSPDYADLPALLTGIASPSEPPVASLLPPALRRRAGHLSRMTAEVVAQAAGRANLTQTPVVYGSVLGETNVAVQMMGSFMDGEGLPSPTAFHNSVHNTPVGYLSIAVGCHEMSPAIAAGPDTSAMAFEEGLCLLADHCDDVLVVLADEQVPAPFTPSRSFPAAAAAFHLCSGARPGALAWLDQVGLGDGSGLVLPGGLEGHPCAPGFRLLIAIASRTTGSVSLAGQGGRAWSLNIEVPP